MMIVNFMGLALVGLIIWWFWLYRPTGTADSSGEEVTIVVDAGIYQPARIRVAAGRSSIIHFLRKDASPCAETVVFPDIDLSEDLPLDTNKAVVLPPMSSGEYAFHCPMQMYKGTLIVE